MIEIVLVVRRAAKLGGQPLAPACFKPGVTTNGDNAWADEACPPYSN